MNVRIACVLFFLICISIQCKKDNDVPNTGAADLQGSWQLLFITATNGPMYVDSGSLNILKFDGNKMQTYTHDTLLTTTSYQIIMKKGPGTIVKVPCINFSEQIRPYIISNDTLLTYQFNVYDGGASTYIRYNP